ncbi:MAG: transcription termination/antitermination protein NusG [Succinivibrionaceae bacterium]|nr:transcription termination/antitermination protein NusG [Succinivibrionaceae bacterium]MEE1340719.1 transcription termination/antitermination protein NusG [Succinivibrionaceae bacterium]
MTVQAPNSNGKMRWYVIQVFSGFEQRVAESLNEQIKLQNMDEYFGEVLVPKEKVKEFKDGKKRESERKFFPGYVFIHMIMNEKSWLMVRHVDKVLGFVGGSIEKPMPISDAEAERILSRLRETEDSPRPKTMFTVGEVVRACDGAFKDFTGTVESVDYEKSRITVSIAIFGRATPVELEFSQVEKEK